MKKSTKLIMTIMSFCLVVMLGVFGIFAVKTLNMSVGGNIAFSADGILASISKGTMSGGNWVTAGDADTKMKAVEITTNKTASQINAEFASWQGLDLLFAESGADVTITFTITNNSAKQNDYLNVKTSIDNGTAVNAEASVSPSWIMIDPGATQTFEITLSVISTEINASLTGFVVGFELTKATEKPEITVTNETELKTALTTGYQVIALNNDISLSSEITLENNTSTTIYSNDKTVSRAEGYTGSLFVVPESASLKLVDIGIDGGAEEFVVKKGEVTMETGIVASTKPAVVASSVTADMTKSSEPAIVSNGNLEADGINVKNHYADTAAGEHALLIAGGTATINNSNFSHNFSYNRGAAVGVGISGLTVGSFAVEKVTFNNCWFEDNFSNGRAEGGGSVYVLSCAEIYFNECTFKDNYAESGGAVLFGAKNTVGRTEDYDFVQAYFDKCLFDGNRVNNDGAAIHTLCAELYITDCDFYRQVGYGGASSVGTISVYSFLLNGEKTIRTVLDGCDFQENQLAAYVFGDHGTLAVVTIKNCNIENNSGSMACLIYIAEAVLSDLTFKNNKNTTAEININSYMSSSGFSYAEYKKDEILVEFSNIIFEHQTQTTVPDILIQKRNSTVGNLNIVATVIGNMTASVEVLVEGNQYIIEKGTSTGDITVENAASVVVKQGATLNGNIYTATSGVATVETGATHNGEVVVVS